MHRDSRFSLLAARARDRVVLPSLVAGLLAAAIGATEAAPAAEDEFFESPYDGGWVGTLSVGKSHIPFQLNLNLHADGGVGFLLISDDPSGSPTELHVLALDVTKVGTNQVVFKVDDSDPLRVSRAPRLGRFGTATFSVSYKSNDDTLSGKATGALKGKISASRVLPDRPLQRIWQGTFKSDGTSTFVQLATTESADGTLGGHADVDGVTGTVAGTRNGNRLELTIALPEEDLEFSGKLKTKNNKATGRLQRAGKSIKLNLVTADGNGKAMQFKKVSRQVAVDLEPGTETVVRLGGKFFALGAVAHTDNPDVLVTSILLKSSSLLEVGITPGDEVADGTPVALRVFNGDGEIKDKGNSLDVTGGGGGGGGVSFSLQVEPIFVNSCAVAGCHGEGSAEAGLSLAPGDAFGNIVGVNSSQQPGFFRVAPGDPDNSYLLRKVSGGPAITGSRMPLGRTPLTADQIATIRDWISQGAPNNRPKG